MDPFYREIDVGNGGSVSSVSLSVGQGQRSNGNQAQSGLGLLGAVAASHPELGNQIALAIMEARLTQTQV